MAEHAERADKRVKLNADKRAIIICALGFLLMLLIAATVNWLHIGKLSAREKELQAQISRAQTQTEENKRDLEYLSGEEYADRYANENDMIRDGETALRGA
jgi:hypothetical protein